MFGEQSLLMIVVAWSVLAVGCSWLAGARWQTGLITLCGVGLLACVSPAAILLLGAGTAATFTLHARGPVSKRALSISIVAIAVLFAAFILANRHVSAAVPVAITSPAAARVVLPLGLAFFCLRWIHYLFESYKGTLRPHTFAEYCCYQFLPSTLPAGPIHRFDEFLRDLRRKRWDPTLFSYGGQRVLYGLVKLIVIGNYLLGEQLTHALAYRAAQPTLGGTYVSAVLFWLKLYVLFSGYSDVAIGFAAAMGFKVRENFNWPFLARNIRDFWQRWHNSLASWCRDYVFTPILSATRSQAIAVLGAMIVLGLWHDVSLRYLIWGAYHGCGIAMFRWFDARAGAFIDSLPRWLDIPWRALACLLTLHFVMFSFPVTSAIEHFLEGL
jgi:alginate O-acetyltransferase complex protein AlgI